MLKYNWTSKTLEDQNDVLWFREMLLQTLPTVIALDTETTGLHIIQDVPFIVQVGFLLSQTEGLTVAVELENKKVKGFMPLLISYLQTAGKVKLIGHNLKFDLHMLANLDYDLSELCADNPSLRFSDTQFYIRHAHDALHTDEGGPPMGLKEYATRYITPTAKTHEKVLDKEKAAITKEYNLSLRQRLGKTQKAIDAYFKDVLFEPSDLPEDMRMTYIAWLQDLPLELRCKVQSNVDTDMIPYTWLNRENILTYAHYDIVYTLEIYYQLAHVIEGRKQEEAIDLEERLVLPFFRMERTGFWADADYLEEARVEMKQYILTLREKLYAMVDIKFSVNQHELFRDILAKQFDVKVLSTQKEHLEFIKNSTLGPDHPATKFINAVQKLRSLEKWYAAYILRFQQDVKRDQRLFTQINQVGTVSGRVTSDFQQFPKEPLLKEDGTELFHPRRIVKAPYKIAYLDYSQIELRIQALYTILLEHPDRNLCRAYMPFECMERNGKFYLLEAPDQEWTPVDVHTETTKAATGLDESDPHFKYLRTTIGKRVNFSKNYGAELARIKSMFPDKTDEECRRINDAYYTAFPGIKLYHKYCADRAAQFSNTQSLFGIRYYNVSGHKLKNLLIQGSAAHLLKYKIIEIDQLLRNEEMHIRMQMQIHDELSFEIYNDYGLTFLPKIKAIMEEWPECEVPIVAECEITDTVWAEKGPVDVL